MYSKHEFKIDRHFQLEWIEQFKCSNTVHFLQDDILLDSDGDSLDNLREMIEGTDPFIADSDGDGIQDGAEVEMGSDPLDEDDNASPPPSQEAEVQLTGRTIF